MGHFESQCRLRKPKEYERVGRPTASKKVRVIEEFKDERLDESKFDSESTESVKDKKTYYVFIQVVTQMSYHAGWDGLSWTYWWILALKLI